VAMSSSSARPRPVYLHTGSQWVGRIQCERYSGARRRRLRYAEPSGVLGRDGVSADLSAVALAEAEALAKEEALAKFGTHAPYKDKLEIRGGLESPWPADQEACQAPDKSHCK